MLWQAHLAKLEDERRSLQAQLKQRDADARTADERLAAAKRELEESSRRVDELVKKHQEATDRLRDEIEELTTKIVGGKLGAAEFQKRYQKVLEEKVITLPPLSAGAMWRWRASRAW